MGKSNKRLEERIAKIGRKPDPLANELKMVISPSLFNFVESLCVSHLEAGRGDQKSRDLIARFTLALRAEAFAKFGHDTLETFALAKLLRQGRDVELERKGRLDAVTHINSCPNKNARLSSEQQTAAEHIIKIWDAFSRFRSIGGGNLDGNSSRSSQILQPLDVMGEDLYKHYRTIYSPWATAASRLFIDRAYKHGAVTLAAIVFKVLMEDVYPEQLDEIYHFPKGLGLKAIKWGLSHYWAPEKLPDWNASERPKAAPPAAKPPAEAPAPKAALAGVGEA